MHAFSGFIYVGYTMALVLLRHIAPWRNISRWYEASRITECSEWMFIVVVECLVYTLFEQEHESQVPSFIVRHNYVHTIYLVRDLLFCRHVKNNVDKRLMYK